MLNEGGKDFESVEAGIYGAVCTRVIDFGTQPGFSPDDDPSHQILLGFELEKFMADGRPFYTMMTAYAGLGKPDKPTKLCKFIEGMTGKRPLPGFDEKTLLGMTCELVMGPNTKGKVTPQMAVKPRVPVELKPEKLLHFSLEPDHYRPDAFDQLSKWERTKVTASPEWQKVKDVV